MSIAEPAGQVETFRSEDDFIQSHIDSFFYDDLEEDEEEDAGIDPQSDRFSSEFQYENKTEELIEITT